MASWGEPIGATTTTPRTSGLNTCAGRGAVKVTVAHAGTTGPVSPSGGPIASASRPEGISTATIGAFTFQNRAIASAYNPLTGGRNPVPRIASRSTSQPKTACAGSRLNPSEVRATMAAPGTTWNITAP